MFVNPVRSMPHTSVADLSATRSRKGKEKVFKTSVSKKKLRMMDERVIMMKNCMPILEGKLLHM